jgi:peptidoglycan/LPS O-acetylase OafA/YrhL
MRGQRIYHALSRVTSSGQFIPQIDGLRFIAIASVVLYHLMGFLIEKAHTESFRTATMIGRALDRGWFGVDIFFVISGFVIALPFAQHHLRGGPAVNLSRYYLRRVTRLEPPYVICITVCFVLLILVKGDVFADLLPHYLATLTYTHNLIYRDFSTINSVAWSLEVEIQFYLLAPLVACVFALPKIERRTVLVGSVVLLAVLQPFLRGVITVATFAHFFLAGFLFVDLYLSQERTHSLAFDATGVLAAASLFWLTGEHDQVYYSPLWILATCAALLIFCLSAFRGRLLSRALSIQWVTIIGGMCYTIYLYHVLVFSFVGRFVHGRPLASGAAMLATLLIACAILFVLFEKPFMRRNMSPRRRSLAVQ